MDVQIISIGPWETFDLVIYVFLFKSNLAHCVGSALYFCFITLTTIGFGDLWPRYSFLHYMDSVGAFMKMIVTIVYSIFGKSFFQYRAGDVIFEWSLMTINISYEIMIYLFFSRNGIAFYVHSTDAGTNHG